MDPKDSKLKDLAQDAGFAPGDLASAQRVLDALAVTPGLSIDPPPGYEARLLAQLSAKLPPVAAPAPRRAAAAVRLGLGGRARGEPRMVGRDAEFRTRFARPSGLARGDRA